MSERNQPFESEYKTAIDTQYLEVFWKLIVKLFAFFKL